MSVRHNLLGKSPEQAAGRIRNYLASPESGGTNALVVHENVINPGGHVPLHMHGVEEVIVCLSGNAECKFQDADDWSAYGAGSVLVIPAGVSHTIRQVGDQPLRQICVFAGPSAQSRWIEPEGCLG